ncbi:hypothetical protein [Sphingomonas sp. BK069]|uniref:hypothetical protein n=1 Tax=Sphingomonas sp. BK069 TaxID=2586979 RepID=UPI00160DAFEA|nr:hypothetical protein [Sphingomonas sp. BK069]MBB3346168.1 hypothetical protein [Sphingomonas sp. BK069]
MRRDPIAEARARGRVGARDQPLAIEQQQRQIERIENGIEQCRGGLLRLAAPAERRRELYADEDQAGTPVVEHIDRRARGTLLPLAEMPDQRRSRDVKPRSVAAGCRVNHMQLIDVIHVFVN